MKIANQALLLWESRRKIYSIENENKAKSLESHKGLDLFKRRMNWRSPKKEVGKMAVKNAHLRA
jgi:hypothetical protein